MNMKDLTIQRNFIDFSVIWELMHSYTSVEAAGAVGATRSQTLDICIGFAGSRLRDVATEKDPIKIQNDQDLENSWL